MLKEAAWSCSLQGGVVEFTEEVEKREAVPGDAERTSSTLITQGPGASLHGASPETTSITDSAHTPLNCPPKVEDGALTSGPKWKSVVFTKTHVAVFPLKNVSMDYACMHAK